MHLKQQTKRSIAGFGEDDAGELYLLSFDDGVYAVQPTSNPTDKLADWPRLLSETKLFQSITKHKITTNMIPYQINIPF